MVQTVQSSGWVLTAGAAKDLEGDAEDDEGEEGEAKLKKDVEIELALTDAFEAGEVEVTDAGLLWGSAFKQEI
ncbi:hypothetical protein L596_013897 [Steinernema carpocapsae]|uniref:Uncharacterized protein n=1 Tax=Steinernema carpocapsae TaxID=34508 RepID=A0A4U5P1L1_STECR|nr:hypothetical protein L596_013897 [Steinernema carpocapsae]